jgi:serine/threonine protein kinase
MVEVFRALDTRLNRPVAIKILRAQFSDRFEREARAISALNHPHICTLYDVGADFLVMEFLEGETLASRLKKGPLPMDITRPSVGPRLPPGRRASNPL